VLVGNEVMMTRGEVGCFPLVDTLFIPAPLHRRAHMGRPRGASGGRRRRPPAGCSQRGPDRRWPRGVTSHLLAAARPLPALLCHCPRLPGALPHASPRVLFASYRRNSTGCGGCAAPTSRGPPVRGDGHEPLCNDRTALPTGAYGRSAETPEAPAMVVRGVCECP